MNSIYASRFFIILISTVLWSYTYASTASIRCENGLVEYLKYSYNIELMIRPLPEHVNDESIAFLGSLIDSILVENIGIYALAEVSVEVSTVSEDQIFPALRTSLMQQSTYLNFRKIIDFSVGCRNVNSLRKLDISRLITDVLSNINITGELLRKLRFSGREELVKARELTMMSQSIIWDNNADSTTRPLYPTALRNTNGDGTRDNDTDSTTRPLYRTALRNTNGDGTRASDREADAAASRHFSNLRHFVYVPVTGVAIALIGLLCWKLIKDNQATAEKPIPDSAANDGCARENSADSIIIQTKHQRSLEKKKKMPIHKISPFYVKTNNTDSQQHVCGNNLNTELNLDRLHKTLKRNKDSSKISKRKVDALVGSVVKLERNFSTMSSLGWYVVREIKIDRHVARVVDKGRKMRLAKLSQRMLRNTEQCNKDMVDDSLDAPPFTIVPFNLKSLICCSGPSNSNALYFDSGSALDDSDGGSGLISYN